MFKNLETKIKFIIFSMVTVILLSSILFIYFSMNRIYTNEFIAKTRELAVQHSQRSDYYLENYEKLAQKIAKNPIIIETVASDRNNPEVNSILTEESQMYDGILGVSLYSGKNAYFSDKVIGSAPDFDFLEDRYDLSGIAEKSDQTVWILRTPDTYEGYYSRSSYLGSKQGLYTCVYKIYDTHGDKCAYLLLDTNLMSLFDLFTKNNVFLKRMDLHIQDDGGKIIPSPLNTGKEKRELSVIETSDGGESLVKDNVIYMFYTLRNSQNRLVMCVMTKGFLSTMWVLVLIVTIAAVFFIILAVIFSRGLIRSITGPIHKLMKKISEYNLDE